MSAVAAMQARIEEERLVAILRTADLAAAVAAVDVLVAVGVTVIEFSLAGGAALEALRESRARHGASVALGTGTVLEPAQVEQSLRAGAEFLIAPNVDERVCRAAAEAGVLHVPGALTPTEVALAMHLGATLVKLFPAGRLGPAYVRDLRGPLPGVRLVATGGVTAETAPEFLAAGCVAVAAGGALGTGDPLAVRALRDAVRRAA